MLIVPGRPLLDKNRLVGRCTRLALRVDAEQVRAELDTLPAHLWGSQGGRVGVHRPAQAVFLRGHAPAEGDKPVEDREALGWLPSLHALIHERMQAPPLRCLLALLPGGAVISPHVDQAPYFGQTIRIHVPILTHAQVWMFSVDRSFHMAEGEVWALNNSNLHGVWNADPARPRIHMICDFLPSRPLIDLLLAGERNLGVDEPAVRTRLFDATGAPRA
ncbi:aspartyl/asparaginyl beta-hydroxylase domain-containing protein [Dokdonella sp.]|uniref:aspartyl/asparaginyl beta-hydroxylase domain-containing protein n=1 Tax=Dokdonella sp. TaxID=2291710 RepID=UPI0031C7C1C2|nr:aspartyl/asparaginyl beta-hydroxylase domain-containing protein [Dokdonella sp.]